MKKLLTIIMLCGVVCGYAQNTPRYAASTQTWEIDTQTWSDVIQMPGCNKEDFTNYDDEPDCRSITEDGKTWYYYNWPYVKQNAATLCPSPWRVPSRSDLLTLLDTRRNITMLSVFNWEGGKIQGDYGGRKWIYTLYDADSESTYWSSTKYGVNTAFYLTCTKESGGCGITMHFNEFGRFVRCVK
jgi:uncharacterized protein (TIGR02145 family)